MQSNEIKLLSYLIVNPQLARGVSLGDDDFRNAATLKVFNLIKRYPNNSKVPYDYLAGSISEELANEIYFTGVLPTSVEPEEVQDLEVLIRMDADKRSIKREIKLATTELDNGAEASEVVAKLISKLVAKSFTNSKTDGRVQTVLGNMRQKVTDMYFNTGIEMIDHPRRNLVRGLKPGSILTIYGYTKNRKSTVAFNIILEALYQDIAVCYIGTEDTADEYLAKLMSMWVFREYGIEMYYDNFLDIEVGQYEEYIQVATEWFNSKKLNLYDPSDGITIDNIMSRMQLEKDVFDTQLVVVDHLQGFSNDYKEMAKFAGNLLRATGQNKLSLIQVSQTTLAEGGSKTRNAPEFLFNSTCVLEVKYEPDEETGGDREIKLKIEFRRDGPSGMKQYYMIEPVCGIIHTPHPATIIGQ